MNYAVIFAGGIGSRMTNSTIPKQFIEISGKPVIIHTLLAFDNEPLIDGICVICLEDWIPRLKEYIDTHNVKKVKWIVPGAETGQQSIYNGLKAVYNDSGDPKNDIVLINDGVRPFVTVRIINMCIAKVREKGSAITVCPVPETVVEITDANAGLIDDIPDRSKWFLSKAPQGFFLEDIMTAHRKALAEGRFDCTNSAELMRRYGYSLYTVIDTPNNIKITTPIDIYLSEILLREGFEDAE